MTSNIKGLFNIECATTTDKAANPFTPENTIFPKSVDDYVAMQKKTDIHIGSVVRVIGAVDSYACGWSANWAKKMDRTVGFVYTVENISEIMGMFLSDVRCWYPFFVLQKLN